MVNTKVQRPGARGLHHRRPPNAGKGRKKGVPNRLTMSIREAFQKLVEDNAENMTKWLKRIAARDPAKAIDVISKLSEYCVPKLGRIEHTGPDGGPIQTESLTNLTDDAIARRLADIAAREAASRGAAEAKEGPPQLN